MERKENVNFNIKSWIIRNENKFLFIFFVLLYISFSFEVVLRPFVFAEDTIFLNEALEYGIKTLTLRHAGYLEVISRLTGLISISIGKITNSYWCVTASMRLISTVLGAYYLSYFYLEDFSWLIDNKYVRFVISFLMLIWMCNFYNLMYNITCMHWYEAVFVFLVGLNLIKGKLPRLGDCILCVLGCLDAPESCAIVLAFLIFTIIYGKYKNMKRYHYVTMFLMIVSSVLQLCCLKMSGKEGALGNLFTIETWISLAKRTLPLVLEAPCFILGNSVVVLIPFYVRILLGAVLWFAVYIVLRKILFGKQIYIYTICFEFVHFFILAVKYNLLRSTRNYWGFSTSATVIATVFFISMYLLFIKLLKNNKEIRVLIPLIAAIFVVGEVGGVGKIDGIGTHYKHYDYEMLGMSAISEIEDRVDFSSDKHEIVTLYAGWELNIPVQ